MKEGMTITLTSGIWFRVWCDDCGRPHHAKTLLRKIAIGEARADGWKRKRRDGKMIDICPACAEKRKDK